MSSTAKFICDNLIQNCNSTVIINGITNCSNLNVTGSISINGQSSSSASPFLPAYIESDPTILTIPYTSNIGLAISTAVSASSLIAEYKFKNQFDTSGCNHTLLIGTCNQLTSDNTKTSDLLLKPTGATTCALSSLTTTTLIAPSGTGLTISFDINIPNYLGSYYCFGLGKSPIPAYNATWTGTTGSSSGIAITIEGQSRNFMISYVADNFQYIKTLQYSLPTTFTFNNWSHIDIVVPISANITTDAPLLYVNNASVASSAVVYASSVTNNFTLPISPKLAFYGTSSTTNLAYTISNFKIYLRALTTAELTTTAKNYQASIKVSPNIATIPTSPLIEYKFGNLMDTSGNNQNLILGSCNILVPSTEKGNAIQVTSSAGASTATLTSLTSSTLIAPNGRGLTISFDINTSTYLGSYQMFCLGTTTASAWSNPGVTIPTGLTFSIENSSRYIMIFYVNDSCQYLKLYVYNFNNILIFNLWNHIDIIIPSHANIATFAPIVYINGTQIVGVLQNTTDTSNSLRLGVAPKIAFYGSSVTNFLIANFRIWLRTLTLPELATLRYTQTQLVPQIYSRNFDNLQIRLMDRAFNYVAIEKYYNSITLGAVLYKNANFPLADDIPITQTNFFPSQFYKGNTIYPLSNNYTTSNLFITNEAIAIGSGNPTTIISDTKYTNLFQLTTCNNNYNGTFGYQASPRFPLSQSNSILCNIGSNFALSYTFKNSKTETVLPQFDTQLAIGWSGELEKGSYYDIFFATKTITVSKIALGDGCTHFLGTTTTGQPKVFATGANGFGQLGDSTNTQRLYPVEITALNGCNITDVVSGGIHTIFLSSNNNRVYSCGNNTNGQLGIGNTTNTSTPTVITQMSGCNITNIACGWAHSLFLSSTCNRVYSCGLAADGRLGNNTTTPDITTPAVISGLLACNISTITAGAGHSVFVSTNDNKVYACGLNGDGQLGIGNTVSCNVPTIIPNLTGCNITTASSGWVHTIFLSSTNVAYGCGYNLYGQLGTGNTTACNVPSRITYLTGCNIVAISTTAQQSYFLSTTNKIVYGTGQNTFGQLGNGTRTQYNTPISIPILSNITMTAFANSSPASYHIATITSLGCNYIWGKNANGQLGTNSTTEIMTPYTQPIYEQSPITITSIATGGTNVSVGVHTLFIGINIYGISRVFSCGGNTLGQLGIGNTVEQNTPVEIPLLIGCNITDIACGNGYSIFLSSTCNRLYSCGQNNYGQVGQGNSTIYNIPTEITQIRGCNITSICCGWGHTIFLSTTCNRVYATGSINDGRTGTNTVPTAPIIISNLTGCNITNISAGDLHTTFISTLCNTVYACGLNQYGQIGDGTVTPRLIPFICCNTGCNITDIACGQTSTIFLSRTCNLVYSTGYNNVGQLGVGNTTQYTSPQVITTLSGCNISSIGAGYNHSLFASALNKIVYSCGLNANGQLGNGTTVNSLVPILIPSLNNIVVSSFGKLCAWSESSMAITSSGKIAVWGLNANGQLGLDDTINRLYPVPFPIETRGAFTVSKVSLGAEHTIILGTTAGGQSRVYGCGLNTNGQLGIGNTVQQNAPVEIAILTGCNITDISTGFAYTIFVSQTNNIVYGCGLNEYGQLGIGSSGGIYTTPRVITQMRGCNIDSVVCGWGHTLFLASTCNRVYGTGNNGSGRIGNNSSTHINTPVEITQITNCNITKVSVGDQYSLFLSATCNRVYACGYNASGQLGTGDTITSLIPIPNLLLGCNITDIDAGATASFFVSSLCNISYACGYNADGRLGFGTTTAQYNTPTVIQLLSGCNITEVSSGINYTLFSSSLFPNTVYSTGGNDLGQLGISTTATSTAPVVVPTLTSVSKLAYSSPFSYHSSAITNNGGIYIWGKNTYGQLGLIDTATRYYPEPLVIKTDVIDGLTFDIFDSSNITLTQIETGGSHSLFLGCNASGVVKVYSAGLNTSGQLGDGTATQRQYPVEITTLTGCNITDISAGATHSIFLSSTCNRVYASGNNASGQLGGAFTTCNIPQVISTLTGLNITSIATGADHSMFFSSSSGKVYMCGTAGSGRLGNSTTTPNITTPFELVAVSSLGISAIAAGSAHSVFLSVANNRVYSCGYNANGGLCVGDVTQRLVPSEITRLYGCNITRISGGQEHTVFLAGATGTVYAGGYNGNGMLGTGNTTNCNFPSPVTALNGCNITDISGVGWVSVFMSRNTNRVYSCGLNNSGQLGIGNLTQQLTPVEITAFRNISIKTLCTGKQGTHTAIVANDGKGYIWGDNANGKLGLDDTTNRQYPELRTITDMNSGIISTQMTVSFGSDTGLSNVSIPNYIYSSNSYHRFDVSMSNNTMTCYLDGFPSNTIALSKPVDITTNPYIRVYQRAGKTTQLVGQLKIWDKGLSYNDVYRASLQYNY